MLCGPQWYLCGWSLQGESNTENLHLTLIFEECQLIYWICLFICAYRLYLCRHSVCMLVFSTNLPHTLDWPVGLVFVRSYGFDIDWLMKKNLLYTFVKDTGLLIVSYKLDRITSVDLFPDSDPCRVHGFGWWRKLCPLCCYCCRGSSPKRDAHIHLQNRCVRRLLSHMQWGHAVSQRGVLGPGCKEPPCGGGDLLHHSAPAEATEPAGLQHACMCRVQCLKLQCGLCPSLDYYIDRHIVYYYRQKED